MHQRHDRPGDVGDVHQNDEEQVPEERGAELVMGRDHEHTDEPADEARVQQHHGHVRQEGLEGVKRDEGPILPVDEEVDHRRDEVRQRDGNPDGQRGEHHEVGPHGVLPLAFGNLVGLGEA